MRSNEVEEQGKQESPEHGVKTGECPGHGVNTGESP